MQCSKAVRQLQFYIDKRLTLEQIRALEFHLATCSACRDELFFLEEIDQTLRGVELIAEPADLTTNIMRRVALSARMERAKKSLAEEQRTLSPLRPSLSEIVFAFVLATVAMLGMILEQLVIRGDVVVPNGQSPVSSLWTTFWIMIVTLNNQTFLVVLWILGTLLGIWITLIVAGADMRNQWFKAVLDRLPVH